MVCYEYYTSKHISQQLAAMSRTHWVIFLGLNGACQKKGLIYICYQGGPCCNRTAVLKIPSPPHGNSYVFIHMYALPLITDHIDVAMEIAGLTGAKMF